MDKGYCEGKREGEGQGKCWGYLITAEPGAAVGWGNPLSMVLTLILHSGLIASARVVIATMLALWADQEPACSTVKVVGPMGTPPGPYCTFEAMLKCIRPSLSPSNIKACCPMTMGGCDGAVGSLFPGLLLLLGKTAATSRGREDAGPRLCRSGLSMGMGNKTAMSATVHVVTFEPLFKSSS